MANVAFIKTGLTGGTATDLDGIPVASITNQDIAFVDLSGVRYNYQYDSSSSAAESSPDVILPDDNGGNGRWLLQSPDTIVKDCKLTLSGGNLLLSRHNGNRLTVDNNPELIPATPVSLAPAGLSVSTLYYIYIYMNGGVMTLEASVTAPVADTTTGVKIKTGDSTRTLVGMVYPVTGPAFIDADAQRYVRSWFNDPGVNGIGEFSVTRTTASTTFTELNTEIRCEFLAWENEQVLAMAAGFSFHTDAVTQSVAIAFDSTTVAQTATSTSRSIDAQDYYPVAVYTPTTLATGYHYTTLLGKVSSGTGSWDATTTVQISASGAK